MKSKLFVYLLAFCFLTACSDDNEIDIIEENNQEQCDESDTTEDNEGQTIDVTTLSEAITTFGIDLFKQSYNEESNEGNLALSPLSVSTALSMASNGAKGQTKDEILSSLGFGGFSNNSINTAFRQVVEDLQSSSSVTLLNANATFWDDSRVDVYDCFLNQLTDYYGSEQQTLDFKESQESVDAINSWIADNTEGKITHLLNEISGDDVMFLLNALYFRANWESPFAEEATYDATFTLSDGSETEVPFMHQDYTGEIPYYSGDDYTAIDFAFEDPNYTMTFILPDETTNLNEFIDNIDSDLISELYTNRLTPIGRMEIKIPLFDIEFKIFLKEVLKKMGINAAFLGSNADFSRLGSSLIGGNIYISKVEHKTRLTLSEFGLEGAAATSVTFSVDSAAPQFTLDRPFIYLVRHKQNNTLLFINIIAKLAIII